MTNVHTHIDIHHPRVSVSAALTHPRVSVVDGGHGMREVASVFKHLPTHTVFRQLLGHKTADVASAFGSFFLHRFGPVVDQGMVVTGPIVNHRLFSVSGKSVEIFDTCVSSCIYVYLYTQTYIHAFIQKHIQPFNH